MACIKNMIVFNIFYKCTSSFSSSGFRGEIFSSFCGGTKLFFFLFSFWQRCSEQLNIQASPIHKAHRSLEAVEGKHLTLTKWRRVKARIKGIKNEMKWKKCLSSHNCSTHNAIVRSCGYSQSRNSLKNPPYYTIFTAKRNRTHKKSKKKLFDT